MWHYPILFNINKMTIFYHVLFIKAAKKQACLYIFQKCIIRPQITMKMINLFI